MKEQRWDNDYMTMQQEFRHSRLQEQRGLDGVNRSFENDYLTSEHGDRLDSYQVSELEPSWATQLDTVGMQPHSREYLEKRMSCMNSDRKYAMISGELIDYAPGIQFSGEP